MIQNQKPIKDGCPSGLWTDTLHVSQGVLCANLGGNGEVYDCLFVVKVLIWDYCCQNAKVLQHLPGEGGRGNDIIWDWGKRIIRSNTPWIHCISFTVKLGDMQPTLCFCKSFWIISLLLEQEIYNKNNKVSPFRLLLSGLCTLYLVQLMKWLMLSCCPSFPVDHPKLGHCHFLWTI